MVFDHRCRKLGAQTFFFFFFFVFLWPCPLSSRSPVSFQPLQIMLNLSSGQKSRDVSNALSSNRCNQYVLSRKLGAIQKDAIKQNSLALLSFQKHCDGVSSFLRKRKSTDNFSDFLELRQLEKDLRSAERPVSTEEFTKRFKARTQALEFGTIHSLIMVNNLQKVVSGVYNFNNDKCRQCGSSYLFDPVAYMNICKHCGFTLASVFCFEDIQQDRIATKTYSKKSSVGRSLKISQQPTALPISGAQPGVGGQTRVSHRVPLYKKYLSQFLEDAEEIPSVVMELVYKSLSYVHIMSSVRCRVTTVLQILKNSEHKSFCSQASRICRVFNGEPVPVISVELMSQMVRKFEAICEVGGLKEFSKRKLHSFEFLSCILFRSEGRSDLAAMVSMHKTKTAIQLADFRIKQIIRVVKQNHPEMTWGNLKL